MKTKLINHRINSIQAARVLGQHEGAEIDLRIYNGELILAHDPFKPGDKFSEWLEVFKGNFLILNLKETGIEDEVIKQLRAKRSDIEYFFLDQPIPSLLRNIALGRNCAARISEFESAKSALKTNATWFWLDSFSGSWSHLNDLSDTSAWLKKKFCLVSPELQGRGLEFNSEINYLLNTLKDNDIRIDAICTKNKSFWKNYI